MQYVFIIILSLVMLFSCTSRGRPNAEAPLEEAVASEKAGIPMEDAAGSIPRQDYAEAREEKSQAPEISPMLEAAFVTADSLSPSIPPEAASSLKAVPPMAMPSKIAGAALLPPEIILRDSLLPNAIIPEWQIPSTISILQDISDSLSTGDYGTAITLFDTIEQREAQTPQVRLLKASVLLSTGDLKEARTYVEAILVQDAENPDALFLLSVLEEAAGKEKEQYQILERILKKNPTYMDALISMGNINTKRRSLKNAADYYDRALKVDSKNADALLGTANVYYLSKDTKKAESLYNQTVSLHPELPQAYTERARFYRNTGKNSLALADLSTAKKFDSEDYWIAIDMGNILLDLNRKTEALAEFQRAVNLNPNFFLPYVYTAGIKDELKDYNGAEKDYTTVTKLKPNYFYAFEGLGIIKIRKGEWFAARDAFLEAYKREPQEINYALLASISSIKGGKPNEQRQLLNDTMRKVNRESLDWYLLRLYYDYTGSVYTGDSNVISRLDNEADSNIKARTTYYLAIYYELRKNTKLAEKYYLIVRDMQCRSIPEWRLNEIALEQYGFKDTKF